MKLTLAEIQSLMKVLHAGAELLRIRLGDLGFVVECPDLASALAKLQRMADEPGAVDDEPVR